ncbi:MAG: hypothetical protein K2N28_00730 [Muribaculaceae bacterium]|nr:hypothetical protein [Muribaculaceae bacterium]
MEIILSNEIKQAAPGYKLVKIEADVVNSETPDELWREVENFAGSLCDLLEIADINRRPGIAATRAAYKACGKDPNRYRPSTEQLCRRVLKGNGLWRVSAVVDVFNLLSLKSGHSIGAFDMDAIEGGTLTLGIGREGEPYEGIGRGELNIAGMPVWRDAVGGVGTPTSDNERTKVSMNTRRLMVTINIYGDDMPVDDIVAEATRLLETYCNAHDVRIDVVS